MQPSILQIEQSILLLLRSGRSFDASDVADKLAAHFGVAKNHGWTTFCEQAYVLLHTKGFANKFPIGRWSLTQLGTHQALAMLLKAGQGNAAQFVRKSPPIFGAPPKPVEASSGIGTLTAP